MITERIAPRVAIAGVPLHVLLVPFPIVCFAGALVTDIVYANTAQIQWTNFSAWLLAVGMLTGSLAALFGLIDLLGSKSLPKPSIGWWHMGGNLLILAIALVNNFVHARDGWTSVVPLGLILSSITVALVIVTGFAGHVITFRHVARHHAEVEQP